MSEFEIKGFNSLQELLEYQFKDYQKTMRVMDSRINELEKKLNVAISILEMVEDNTKMPHKHSDFQVRLHCLAERAREALEIIKADK